MLIEIKCAPGLKKYATAWLTETYDLINKLDAAYDLLCAGKNSWVTSELTAMGVSPEEGLVYLLDEQLGTLDTPISSIATSNGCFGSGTAIQKYLNAFVSVDYLLTRIKTKADYAEPFVEQEITDFQNSLYQTLGDLIYSFSRVLFLQNPRNVLASEAYTYSQDIQAFFARAGKSAECIASELVEKQSKYITTIPLFEKDPEAWRSITKALDPALVDILVDYGEFITALDIRAARMGCLTVDENFTDIIRERAEDQMHIINQAPAMWQQFIKMIPDSEVQFFEAINDKISVGMIEGPVKEGKITPEYLAELHSLFSSMGVATTNVFSANT